MLVLKIRKDGHVMIGTAKVQNIGDSEMRIGIEAPISVPIVRDNAKKRAVAAEWLCPAEEGEGRK